jgi:hypothetical protein
MSPGESQTINKVISVPDYPPKLDLYLLEDETASFEDDIATLQALAPQIFDDVRDLVTDSRFGVGGFRDFPFDPWGDSDDWAYRRVGDMTYDRATFVNKVNELTAGGGGDWDESQYEALYQAATGAGKTYDGYTIPPDQNPSFRDNAFKVIVLTTDASFHMPPGYPGPSRDETVNALNSAGIIVIALKAPGSWIEMDDIAAATGGVVKTIEDGSADIAEAIVDALGEVLVDVTLEAACDPGLAVTFSQSSWINVDPPTTLPFDETVSVDSGFTGILVTCTVTAKVNEEVEIGTQTITVNVNQPPEADAGPDQTEEQTYYQGADVTLDGSGSSDPNEDPLTYLWTWSGGSAIGVSPIVSLPLGTTTITLTVHDGEFTDADTVDINVVDTTPPELTIPEDVTVEQETGDGTVVPLTATATDICDADPTITNDTLAIYPLGTTTVTFTATDDAGNSASCSMTVTVVDTTPPEAECLETVNPHGKKVPPAGSTTLPGPKGGQNEDGFYELIATDICDISPEIFVVDTGSPAVFGPFVNGTKIKYTQDVSATPVQKTIGSSKGNAGDIDWHIIGNGDADLKAVDFSGNVGWASCLVPPPPK